MEHGAGAWVRALCVCAALGAGACSSDDGGSKPNGASAPQKCEDFAHAWCSRAVNCLVQLGTLTQANASQNLSECENEALSVLPCSKAVQVSSTYDQCMSEVQSLDCSVWNVSSDKLGSVSPPTSCQKIILINQ